MDGIVVYVGDFFFTKLNYNIWLLHFLLMSEINAGAQLGNLNCEVKLVLGL